MMSAIEAEIRQRVLELEVCRVREEVVSRAGTREEIYAARLATVRASGALEGAVMMQAVRRLYRGGTAESQQ